MKEKKIGMFTLAVSLILIGVLFLLNNFFDIKVHNVLSIAWPVIIILLGLEIVFSKILYKNDEDKLAISGKSIIFIILIVSITFVFSEIQRFPLCLNINDNFFPISYKNETIANRDMTVNVNDKKKLKIINSFGNINVKKGNEEDIKINMLVKMRHNYEEADAQKVVDDVLQIINDSGDTVKLINNREKYIANNEVRDLEVNLDITIPKDMDLDINNRQGEIMINDCTGSASVSNNHGNISIDNLKGDLDIKNSYGEVEIIDVEGNAKIQNRHGKVCVKNVSKDTNITAEYANINISDMGGNVEISNVHESIKADKVNGNLGIESRYCRIDTDNINGDIDINARHENILVKDINGNVKIANEYGNIKLARANKDIDIRNRHGQVIFESDKVITEKLEIENEYDTVDVSLPASQEGKFYVYSKDGRISNDFELNVQKNNNEEIIDEAIGDKNVNIKIKAIGGNIRIDN